MCKSVQKLNVATEVVVNLDTIRFNLAKFILFHQD